MDRYIGLDVHAKSCTFAVVGSTGRRLQSQVVETNGKSLVEFIKLVPRQRHLCLEESTYSMWLYEILYPHVDEIVVASVQAKRGNKSDKLDAFGLADDLRTGHIERRVYKNPRKFATLRELARVHAKLVRDDTRAHNRLAALFRSRGKGEALKKDVPQSHLPLHMRRAATRLIEAKDAMAVLRKHAEEDLKLEARKHEAVRRLETCPGFGPIRAAQFVATVIDPKRFRTKRQLWSYSGLAIVTRVSDEWGKDGRGDWKRTRKALPRGLNRNRNAVMKNVVMGASGTVLQHWHSDPLYVHYQRLVDNGTKPNLARLTLARRIAATALAMWKNEEEYDPKKHVKKT